MRIAVAVVVAAVVDASAACSNMLVSRGATNDNSTMVSASDLMQLLSQDNEEAC